MSEPLDQGYESSSNVPEKAEALRTKFLRYKNILLAWWWIPALTVSTGLCLQAWLTLSKPVQYSSHGRIIVSGRISIPEGATYNEEASNFFGTQQELMQSQEVLRRAAARVQSLRPDLEPVPVSLAVNHLPRTAIFYLSATGSAPEYTRAYLDAVMEEYISLRRGMVSEKSQNTLSAITEELLRLENDVRRGEDELFDWQKKNNLVFLQEEGNSAGEYLAGLNQKLARLETEYQLLDSLSVDQNAERTVSSAATKVANADDNAASAQLLDSFAGGVGAASEYLRARQQLLLLETEEKQLADVLKPNPNNPRWADLQARIRQQKKLLDILRQQSAERFETSKDALEVQIAATKREIKEWEARALDLSRRMGEFERLRAKVDRQKGLYERLLGSVQNVDVNANIQQDVVSIMEPASPASQITPPLARQMMMGGMAGLLLGFGVLFLIGILDDRIVSISELQSVFEQEVVGIIPKSNLTANPLLRDDDDRQPLVEAFRNIRSWIFFTPWEGAPPKTILVTSSIPEEGKSTVSANLAIALASSGSETLLVDADLRRGRLHRVFGIDGEPGFGEVLAGEMPFEKAVIPADVRHLSILPRGKPIGRGNEIYLGKSFERFINETYSKYDYIVFDSCPVLAVDDTSSIAPKVDAVFFVIRSAFTGIRLARKSLAVLEARRINVQGIIYNCVDWTSSDYPYYKYHYGRKEEASA